MRRVLLLGLLCVLSGFTQSIPLTEYRARRAALQKNLEGTIVLFGKAVAGDEVFGFVQEALRGSRIILGDEQGALEQVRLGGGPDDDPKAHFTVVSRDA